MRGKFRTIRAKKRKDPTVNTKMLASCYGKIRYNKQDRERALAGKPTFLNFYKCKFCAYWHIGRKPWGKKVK